MKQIFTVFFGAILLLVTPYKHCAQTISGIDIVDSIYENQDVSEDFKLELACFADHGWFLTKELKSEQTLIDMPGEGENIAERLILSGVTSQIHNQFFKLDDDRIVVVIKEDSFNRILSRYIVNIKNARALNN